MLKKLKHTLSEAWAAIWRRVAGLFKGQAAARVGYYAALAALLVILGAASYAYRHRADIRRASPSPTPPPRAVVAVQTPLQSAPTPVPEPVYAWPAEGEIIGAYSPEAPVWSSALSQWQTHPAVDIAALPGEAVYAWADGTVTDAWSDALWGNVIAIEHADGYASAYAGLNTLNMVAVGDEVAAGDVIGAVGQSAVCEADLGWHLHFALTKDGAPADFEAIMAESGF